MHPKLTFGFTDSLQGLSSISALDTLSFPRHRWYFVKEAFSPYLVERAIEDSHCSIEDDLIIDMFSGGGTVPLTATLHGFKAVGFEVNPFLAFVSRAKLLRSRGESFNSAFNDAVAGANEGALSPLEDFSTFSESSVAGKWLFNKGVLRAFEGGWKSTIGKKHANRDLIRLCLIGAAMDVCNATKDGKCLRYRKDWKGRRFGKTDFIQALTERFELVKSDLKNCPLKVSDVYIHPIDSREKIGTELLNDKFKLCIMSPPYLNSFDYSDVYRPELFLGKFVQSMEDLRALRLRTIRSHVQVSWEEPKEMDFGQHFEDSLAEIELRSRSLWNKRIPSMIPAYFEDMKTILENLMYCAKSDSAVWIVVSTSAYAGVEIPVDLILADIGCKVGWFLREVNVVHYLRRVSGQQWDRLRDTKETRPYLRESIIILDATPRKRKARC
ncbi:MAG TPA: hypothetical protein VEF34_01620 [Syntrophobacteraceae bacterium]|nr:hypothetical protein [Syntrophobacteraceae bacterium]